MKKLTVTIKVEMSVPDDWELAPTSGDGQVLKVADGQYIDLTFEPMFASDPEETWTSTNDDDVLNEILEMVESEDVAYEFVTH